MEEKKLIRIPYTVTKEDNLHRIALKFNTSVENILSENVDICSYSLKAGDILGITTEREDVAVLAVTDEEISLREYSLLSQMRKVWAEHMIWTRGVIVSIMGDLGDLEPTEARLMQNPKDMAAVFGRYYDAPTSMKIEGLFSEHLRIGGELFGAIKAGNKRDVERKEQEWTKNAIDIATFFSSINPHYHFEEIKKMLFEHLYLTGRSAELRQAGDFGEDVLNFDRIFDQSQEMADMFSRGIIMQFMK